jgi:hypothetical protein
MSPRQRKAISAFHTAVKELKGAGVIRSHRYLGDIAEFLCAVEVGIDLATNLRQIGHDGMRGTLRAQIKYGGGSKTNVDLGHPDTYDEVYVVLGKESVVRSGSHMADFVVYKLTSSEVHTIGPTKKGKYSCGRGSLSREPDLVISLADATGA